MMLCAFAASFVFQGLPRTLVGFNWVVLGLVVRVLDPQLDSVLDPLIRLRGFIKNKAVG
jgi:hypothetical protein